MFWHRGNTSGTASVAAFFVARQKVEPGRNGTEAY